jgi:hypothetical protein
VASCKIIHSLVVGKRSPLRTTVPSREQMSTRSLSYTAMSPLSVNMPMDSRDSSRDGKM